MRRTNCKELDVKSSAEDIVMQFKNKDRNFLVNAIRNGSMGEYGVTFSLNAQVLGYWVYQYSKAYNIRNGLI